LAAPTAIFILVDHGSDAVNPELVATIKTINQEVN